MRHYGERPPAEMFDRFNPLGYWRWIPPDPRSWFDDEPGYWKWYPGPQSNLETMGAILREFYLPPLIEEFNKPILPALLEPQKKVVPRCVAQGRPCHDHCACDSVGVPA